MYFELKEIDNKFYITDKKINLMRVFHTKKELKKYINEKYFK